MGNKFKDIDTKNDRCYFFNVNINIKNFDRSKMKSHTKIFLFTTLDM